MRNDAECVRIPNSQFSIPNYFNASRTVVPSVRSASSTTSAEIFTTR